MISTFGNKDGIVSDWWDEFYSRTQTNTGDYSHSTWLKNAQKIVKFQFRGKLTVDKNYCTYRIDFKNASDCTAFLLTYCK